MRISTLRERVGPALLDFAATQWAQLGVFVESSRHDEWAQDPEALLLFTLEIGRDDARLFDEVLDWLRHNGGLVSARRLSWLSRDDPVRPILDAAVAWTALHGSPLRLTGGTARPRTEPQPLFREQGLPGRSDATFLAHGFAKPPTAPSGKSAAPDPDLPINLAFKLRRHFGVTARAEIVRFLLTSAEPASTTAAIAEAAASTKRNVNNALTDLASAGDIERYVVGNEARYRIDRERWATFLGLEAIPEYRDWPNLLRALAEIRRWLNRPDLDELSDYLRASEARRLMVDVGPLLQRAGISVSEAGLGPDYWPSFTRTVENALMALEPRVPLTGHGHGRSDRRG